MAETLEKVVTNSEAQSAAKALIDHFFRNDGARVSVCIPATDSDTDVVLTRYIKQQAARDLAIGELVEAAEARLRHGTCCPCQEGMECDEAIKNALAAHNGDSK